MQIVDYFGIRNVVRVASKLGLKDKFRNDLTIALGSQESTLLDMTTAYATVANDGVPVIPHAIKYITSNGRIIFRRDVPEEEPIFDSGVAESMKYLLFSVIDEGTGRRAGVKNLINKTKVYNMINSDNQYFIGGKTGSTQDYKDAWFIGFADDYIIGIWFGNDDNTSTNGIMGVIYQLCYGVKL